MNKEIKFELSGIFFIISDKQQFIHLDKKSKDTLVEIWKMFPELPDPRGGEIIEITGEKGPRCYIDHVMKVAFTYDPNTKYNKSAWDTLMKFSDINLKYNNLKDYKDDARSYLERESEKEVKIVDDIIAKLERRKAEIATSLESAMKFMDDATNVTDLINLPKIIPSFESPRTEVTETEKDIIKLLNKLYPRLINGIINNEQC